MVNEALKQYLLIAGVDYEHPSANFVDFGIFCSNRRRRIVEAETSNDNLKFTTINFRSGELAVTDVTYAGGKKVEKNSVTRSFQPISMSNYDKFIGRDGAHHYRFKEGQWGVASILNVYSAIKDIGATSPGSLREVSIFSHAGMGGPILVNSYDNRMAMMPIPSTGSAPTTTLVTAKGTMRDPDDMDARAEYDFVPPTLEPSGRAQFRSAFATDGFLWLWGCSFPHVIHHILTAIEKSKDFKPSGLDPEEVLTLERLNGTDIRHLDKFLRPLFGTSLTPGSPIRIKFKYLKHFLCTYNQASYAARLADASNRTVRAAPLGTYAVYEKPSTRLPLMKVEARMARHLSLYKEYLGMSFDPESRRYALYTPGATCPVP